jgi:hypothetical protein
MRESGQLLINCAAFAWQEACPHTVGAMPETKIKACGLDLASPIVLVGRPDYVAMDKVMD